MRGISKRFGAVAALSGVSLDLKSGEVHVLAGENGAGKSTLMKILSGALAPDAGEILLQGSPLALRSPRDAEAAGIAMIHQELALVGTLGAAENIHLGREPVGRAGLLDRATERRHAAELLARLGVDLDLDRPVQELPLGLQQLVEIAKALSRKARILVMDEPTSALTLPEAGRLLALVRSLRDSGTAIAYITHKMEEIDAIADRVTVLRDGISVESRRSAELPRETLIALMVGRPLSLQIPRRAGAPRPGPTLRVEGLTLRADGLPRPILDGVYFEAARGEILGIAGLVGSGNSELLGALFGRYGALPGKILMDGAGVPLGSPREAIRTGFALLTNDRKATGLVLPMSVLGNATLASLPALSPAGCLSAARERRLASPHLEALGVPAGRLSAPVWQLSGGNQQKVVLAKWLLTKPQLLLLDEPTRGIDVGAKHEIYSLIHRLADAGATVLLVTSELPELLGLSDRILVMREGRIAATLRRDEATQERVLEAAAGARAA
jgi:ABC-type sugar transport system ATPase subunit